MAIHAHVSAIVDYRPEYKHSPKLDISLFEVPRELFDAMPGKAKEYVDDKGRTYWMKRVTKLIRAYCDEPKPESPKGQNP